MYEGSDIFGAYISCINCGHQLTEIEEIVLKYSRDGGSISLSKPAYQVVSEATHAIGAAA
jgi:hypothetical protein